MANPRGAIKAALSALILHKQVKVTWTRRGRYRRIIGQVYLDGEWINKCMVAQGWARQFRRYSRSKELAEVEADARHAGRSLYTLLTPKSCKHTRDLASSK